MSLGCCLFDTAVGGCAIGWSARGVVGVELPGRDEAATLARLRRRGAVAAPPPVPVQAAIDAIVALLHGRRDDDLTGIVLDLDGVPDFARRVYAAARAIAPGQTSTYGELAARLGEPGAARAVGRALGENPYTIIVPCHRVLAAGGDGGFSAPGGVSTKLKLLAIEGVPVTPPLF